MIYARGINILNYAAVTLLNKIYYYYYSYIDDDLHLYIYLRNDSKTLFLPCSASEELYAQAKRSGTGTPEAV